MTRRNAMRNVRLANIVFHDNTVGTSRIAWRYSAIWAQFFDTIWSDHCVTAKEKHRGSHPRGELFTNKILFRIWFIYIYSYKFRFLFAILLVIFIYIIYNRKRCIISQFHMSYMSIAHRERSRGMLNKQNKQNINAYKHIPNAELC